MDKLRSDVPMPKNISKKARAILGLQDKEDNQSEGGADA